MSIPQSIDLEFVRMAEEYAEAIRQNQTGKSRDGEILELVIDVSRIAFLTGLRAGWDAHRRKEGK